MAFLDKEGLTHLWGHITSKLSKKVDKVEGKGLSTNDYTAEDKEKLTSAVTEKYFNAELKKRPIAYAPMKGELNWEFSGNISDYESTVLGSPDGTDTNTMIAVKVLDVAPSAEERELISYTMHTEIAPGATPSINQTNGQWSPFNGDERAYAVFSGNMPVMAAVYSTVSEGEISITPGLWVMQMQVNGENALGVQSLHVPIATLPGVKMSADLIDAEWMAKKCSIEVEVNSENISNYLTDEISDLGAMFGFDVTLKLSDYFVSQDEFINSKCIAEFGEVTGTEIPLIMGPGTADMGYTVTIKNLWAYQLSDYVLLIADEGASVYVQDMNTTFSVPKGIYLGADSEEELLALGTLKFYCPEVADVIVPLPEKYLPDTVIQAGIKIVEDPLNIEWDGVTGDRDTANLSLVCVKVSDIILTKEELSTGYITVSDGSTQSCIHILAENIVELEQKNGIAIVAGGEPNPDGTHLFPFVYIIHTADNTFPSAGIYFVYTTDFYISNLSIPSYYRQTITKKIDPELVDMEWYAGKTEPITNDLTIEWDGVVDDKYTISIQDPELGSSYTYVKVSDAVPTAEELTTCEVYAKILDSEELQTGYTIADAESLGGMPCIFIGNEDSIPMIIIVLKPHTNAILGNVQQSGVYFSSAAENLYTSKLYLPSYTQYIRATLPEKYLPQETTNLNNLENGNTLVETVFNLFTNGGGVTDMGMEYVNRILCAFENKTFAEFTVSAVGYKIKCPLTCVSGEVDGLLKQVSFTFLMDFNGIHRVTVFLLANISNNLRVLVETFQ